MLVTKHYKKTEVIYIYKLYLWRQTLQNASQLANLVLTFRTIVWI